MSSISTSASTLKAVRQIHNAVGLFFAPTILFFAITGGLQMFGLHETSRGSSYVPPAILVHLSQLHKKGTLFVPQRRPNPSPAGDPGNARPDGPKAEAPRIEAPKADAPKLPQGPGPARSNPLPIKIFFALTALALLLSTCTGIIMGWKYARRKSSVVLLLAAGVVLPVLLLFL